MVFVYCWSLHQFTTTDLWHIKRHRLRPSPYLSSSYSVDSSVHLRRTSSNDNVLAFSMTTRGRRRADPPTLVLRGVLPLQVPMATSSIGWNLLTFFVLVHETRDFCDWRTPLQHSMNFPKHFLSGRMIRQNHTTHVSLLERFGSWPSSLHTWPHLTDVLCCSKFLLFQTLCLFVRC